MNNYRIDNGKSIKMPLGGHFKLSLKDCPVKDCDIERMSKVPYENTVGSLMYTPLGRSKVILKVLSGVICTCGFGVWDNRGNHVDVTGFVDSDYSKDPNKEAEYMALTEIVKEAIG
ncbi:hypothetical protein Tco_0466544 [Tanacetum coccineum]